MAYIMLAVGNLVILFLRKFEHVIASSKYGIQLSIQISGFSFLRFHLTTETLLSHKAMLTNEYFKITTRIENDQNIVFENVSLIITVPQHLRNKGINKIKQTNLFEKTILIHQRGTFSCICFSIFGIRRIEIQTKSPIPIPSGHWSHFAAIK